VAADLDNREQAAQHKVVVLAAAVMLIRAVRRQAAKLYKVLNQDKAVHTDLVIQDPDMDKVYLLVMKSAVEGEQVVLANLIQVVLAVQIVLPEALYSAEVAAAVVLEITAGNQAVAEVVVMPGD
jgi:hypothetical protein